jgi:hypothetical protein
MNIQYRKTNYAYNFAVKIDETALALGIPFTSDSWIAKIAYRTAKDDEYYVELFFEDGEIKTEYGHTEINDQNIKELFYAFLLKILETPAHRMVLTMSNVPLFIRRDLFQKS